MKGPKFTTFVKDIVCVPPEDLNSNLLSNIKQIFTNTRKGKNLSSYGFISDVHSLDSNIGNGKIIPEDNTASCYYDITFKVTLWNPIVGTVMVARIEEIFKNISYARSGPIVYIIDGFNINKEKFRFNNTKNAYFPLNKNGKEGKKAITAGDFISVRVINKKIVPKDNKIIVIGFLEGIPTKEDIKQSILDNNSSDLDITELDDIVTLDQVNEESEEESDEEASVESDSDSSIEISTRIKDVKDKKDKSKEYGNIKLNIESESDDESSDVVFGELASDSDSD